MRDYVIRFWKRMLPLGRTEDDILFLKDAGVISQGEYEMIVSQ